jgi:hypothetical protein
MWGRWSASVAAGLVLGTAISSAPSVLSGTALAAAATPLSAPAMTQSTAHGHPLRPAPGVVGFYAGYGNQVGVHDIAGLLKHPVVQAMDFLDGSSWSTIESSPAKVVPGWDAAGYQMTWSIPILPNTGASLRVGATGAYNRHFASVASYLVAHGQALATIRLAWEFNGFWFTWSAISCRSCFVAYWRQVVGTMRSVPGSNFRFEWTPVAGLAPYPLAEAYPGNAWVDLVGLDIYDEVYHARSGPQRWHALLTETSGLNWVAAFASSHHKALALPEWGLGFPPAGGGDNPYYITRMAQYIAAHDVVSAIYWQYGTSRLNRAPKSLRAFVDAFS